MRCANPECRIESAYLRGGTLHWIEEVESAMSGSRGRFIWLCNRCAPMFVVQNWRPPGERLRSCAMHESHAAAQESSASAIAPVSVSRPGRQTG